MSEYTKINILVVDDVLENTTLLSRILRMSGYEVQVAQGGAEGIQKAASRPPDLIILDIKMPEMDGYETCQQLKADRRTRDIPIIFISALDDIGDKSRAFKAGGVDYIVKPFEYDEVQARVDTHLVLRKLRLQLEEANHALAARVDELTVSHRLLEERESRLSAFVAALPNLSFIMNEEGRYLEIVAGERSLLVTQPERLIGQLVTEVMPSPEGKRMLDAIHIALEQGTIQVLEYKIPVLSGGEHWFESRIARMENDSRGHGKVVMIASEITERVKLYQEIQRLANEDGLTGCLNRRYRRPLSLLMMDIDNFKTFNDNFGHHIGDEVLRQMVKLCQKELRGQDMLARYGGDEFVVMMPETSEEGALVASRRLHEKIKKMEIDPSTKDEKVTVSMGLASLDIEANYDLDTLIRHADAALYEVKSAGKNGVKQV